MHRKYNMKCNHEIVLLRLWIQMHLSDQQLFWTFKNSIICTCTLQDIWLLSNGRIACFVNQCSISLMGNISYCKKYVNWYSLHQTSAKMSSICLRCVPPHLLKVHYRSMMHKNDLIYTRLNSMSLKFRDAK